MTRLGLDYGEALKQAQALGYAEANPSTDVDGIDTWHKLILSSNVAFGVSLDREAVPAAGISRIEADDIINFKAHGYVCKLMSTGKNLGDKCAAYVQPTLVPVALLEAAVPTNYNLITLDGDVSGRQSFYGQGAGRYPTAYNVVQDCVSILAGKSFYCPYGKKVSVDNSGKLTYYVRGGWDGAAAETWGRAVITEPVAVSEMHAWLKDHPGAFLAAIAE
jgi:homoserine dehydrogenase